VTTDQLGDAAGDLGVLTLEHFARASRLNAWIYGQLRDRVRGDVLEVGSGLGSMSRLIVRDARRLVLADVDPRHLEAVRQRLGDAAAQVTLVQWDLAEPPPPSLAGQRFDTIVAVNVIEHLSDDAGAVRALAALLRPAGELLVYVPACPFAFSPLDQGLDHRRRYTRRSLGALLGAAGLLPALPPRHVNRLGLIGWLCLGRMLQRRAIPPALIDLFERIVPLARALDRAFGWCPIGLGLIANGRKPA
jgi:SAM-dependent methyltransferase